MVSLPLELKESLEQAVAAILDEVGIDRPPVDALKVARHLGLIVHVSSHEISRGRIVERSGQTVICVQDEPRPERSQWTVAHEIGEHWLSSADGPWNTGETPLDAATRESLANRFANLLLVPSHWLEFDSRMVGYDLRALKEIYQTASHEVLAWRMLDLRPAHDCEYLRQRPTHPPPKQFALPHASAPGCRESCLEEGKRKQSIGPNERQWTDSPSLAHTRKQLEARFFAPWWKSFFDSGKIFRVCDISNELSRTVTSKHRRLLRRPFLRRNLVIPCCCLLVERRRP